MGSNDLFAFRLGYNEGANPLYNGNIALTQWKTANTDSSLKTYNYTYDALNRITSAIDNTAKFNLTGLSYDKNGNIMGLIRQGHVVENPKLQLNFGYGTMDNLVYTYDSGNKLLKVTDNANDTYGFKDSTNTGNDFTYDQNGNMKTDANKSITNIVYNHLNLPTQVSFGASNYIDYLYDATGVKLEKKVTQGSTITKTLYAGNYVYEKTGSGSEVLQFFNHAEGYVDAATGTFEYVYQYKDHLGNVRLTYADSDGNGSIDSSTEILSENSYYPFGMTHSGYNNVVSANANSTAEKFKYNGKELEEELGKDTYAYGWRDYDPAIGRFNKIDRFSEKYYSLSTYSYAGNNPIYFVDVQGDSIASGSSTRKANRIERRAERRADRLDRQADRREARGQDVADLRERSSELRQSGQDIRDMRADTINMYRFASATGREAKKLKLAGPATTKTGTTKSGLNEITLFTESNMGNMLHETRHGGQHSRGEINALTQSHGALGLNAEVSAYRAQYSWDGSLNYYSHNVDQTDFVNRTLLDNRSFNFAIRNINNINQINLNMVRDIGKVFDASGMSLPASINGTFWILPLYSN